MRGPFGGKGGYTYIMGNPGHTVLYTGVTADIEARVWQHKHGQGGMFTAQYNCCWLLWFEAFERIKDAIARESRIKNWQRAWKLKFVKKENPVFRDLAADWFTSTIPDHTDCPSASPPGFRLKAGMTGVRASPSSCYTS